MEQQDPYASGPTQDPYASGPPTGGYMEPHRGTMILVLGILGLVVCQICGIVAWVMANGDLKKMAAGQMDPEGKGMTDAGKICGIVSLILMIISFVFLALYFVFIFAVIASNA